MAVTEKIAVSLAQDVYYEQGRPPLPSGWSVFLNCTIGEQENSYFGVAYQAVIDARHASIVIAHRGTDSPQDKVEDIEMCSAMNKVPAQFYTSTIPFIQNVFSHLDKSVYNQTTTYLYFTGHSLGATLAEMSIIRYINYFASWKPTYNPYRVWGNTTYVFESPGSVNLVQEQLFAGEITESDIADGGETIEVYNSEVDGINTCMPTSASYGRRRIYAAIGNDYSCLAHNIILDYHPSLSFYFYPFNSNCYTLTQHAMAYVYDWVTNVFNRSNPNTYRAVKVSEWPIGLEAGFHNYLSYYGPDATNYNFMRHNLYWQQYTTILWNQNPSLHKEFGSLQNFQLYYYTNELFYIGSYFLDNINLDSLPNSNGAVLAFPSSQNPSPSSLSGIGDVNEDGIPDLLLALYSGSGDGTVETYIIYGGQNGVIDLSSFPSKQGSIIKNSNSNNNHTIYTGYIVRGTGDINQDGIADFMVVANPNFIGDKFTPCTYLIYGGQSGIIDLAYFSSNQGFIILNTYCSGYIGPTSISAAGDLNGDGIPDLLLGFDNIDISCYPCITNTSTHYLCPGVIYGVYGGQSGVINLGYFHNNQGFIIRGISASSGRDEQHIGIGVSGLGDVNEDGKPDILIATRSIDDTQIAAYVIYGGQSGLIELQYLSTAQGFIIKYPSGIKLFSNTEPLVSAAGDINGDRIPDFIIRIPSINNLYIFLVYGGHNGIIDLGQFPNQQGFRIQGPGRLTYLDSINGLGDVNGDGFADLLITCARCNGNPIAWVVYGGNSGIINLADFPNNNGFIATSFSSSYGDYYTYQGSATGDIDRDGLPDIFLGIAAQKYDIRRDHVSSLIYSRRSPMLYSTQNSHKEKQKEVEEDTSQTKALSSIPENRYLSLFNMAGKQFNVFYQQAKDYLASFWRAEFFQTKEELSAEQILKRKAALDKILKKLASLEAVLDLGWHDNKDYLKKVTGFYQRMVSNWKEDVSTLMAQDIRDLQEDIGKISHAVYFPDIPYVPQRVGRTPYGFFAGTSVNTSTSYPALAADQIPRLT